MTYYVEWTSKVNNRKGRMIPIEALDKILQLPDPGYESVYMFDEVAAKEIKARGSSKGLDQYSVISKALVMDIDSGHSGLEMVERKLEDLGLAYLVYSSGGKGYHVYVPHQLVQDIALPHSHKKWVESVGLSKIVDMSLYQHGRLISLVGRIHPKTKKRKEFGFRKDGKELQLPIIEPAPPTVNFDIRLDLELLAIGLQRFVDMVNTPPTTGNRHTKIWGAAKDLAETGLEYSTIIDIAQKVNETWKEQKTPEEIEQAVQQAWKSIAK